MAFRPALPTSSSTGAAAPKADSAVGERRSIDEWIERVTTLAEPEPREALALARQALARATAIRYTTGMAQALRLAAACHYRLGELDAALDLFQRGLAAARRARIQRLQSNCVNGIGVVLDQMGDYDGALRCFARSLELAGGASNPRAWVAAAVNVGHVLEHMGQHEQAVEHYERTLRELADPNTYGVPMLHMNHGVALVLLGRHPEAVPALEAAVAGFRSASMLIEAVHAACNLAYAYMKIGHTARGLDLIGAAHQESLALQAQNLQWRALNVKGALLQSAGRLREAHETLEKGLALRARCKDAELLQQTHENLADVCEALGDLAAALSHLRQSHDLKVQALKAAARPAVRSAVADSVLSFRGKPRAAAAAVAKAAQSGGAAQARPAALASDATPAVGRSATRLSERELAVLKLIAKGYPNRSAGEALGISAVTVRHHVSSILGKLGATKRAEAVAIAAASGLLSAPVGAAANSRAQAPRHRTNVPARSGVRS